MGAKRVVVCCVVLIVVLTGASASLAQEAAALAIWTSGHIDVDNSVYYNVLVATGAEAASGATITANLPDGATFVQEFWKPEQATFAGESDGILTWTLDTIPAESVVGPFSFQVTFANSDAGDFAPPAQVKAQVVSSAGALETAVNETTLARPGAAGSVQVTPEGSTDFLAVGETGMWVNVPADAVSQAVSLTLRRRVITPTSVAPEITEPMWWCSRVSIMASADVAFAQPIVITVPLRRALTPGHALSVFAQNADRTWTELTPSDAQTGEFAADALAAPVFAVVAPSGTDAYLVFAAAHFSAAPVTLMIGVNTELRVAALATTTPLIVIQPPALQNATWLEMWR